MSKEFTPKPIKMHAIRFKGDNLDLVLGFLQERNLMGTGLHVTKNKVLLWRNRRERTLVSLGDWLIDIGAGWPEKMSHRGFCILVGKECADEDSTEYFMTGGEPFLPRERKHDK